MKLLKRNMTEFEYLPYMGLESDLNEEDEHTGEFYPVYADPVPYRGNISSPSGYTNQTFHGIDIRYTNVLVMDDPNVDIHETGLIRWKNDLYDIRAIRPSINGISIALKKQTKDHSEGDG